MVRKASQKPAAEGKGRLDRRDFTKGLTALFALLAIAPRVRATTDPYQLTAERVAALVEAPETPPALRELLWLACCTIDCFSAPEYEDEDGEPDLDFQFDGHPSPDDIRRGLPTMLREIGNWTLADNEVKAWHAPGGEGGGQ